MTLPRFFMRTVVFSVLATLFVVIFLFVFPKYRELNHLRATRERLDRETRSLQTEIAEIRARQERFATDPEFVRRIAHQNRRLRPNEILFVVEDPDTPDL